MAGLARGRGMILNWKSWHFLPCEIPVHHTRSYDELVTRQNELSCPDKADGVIPPHVAHRLGWLIVHMAVVLNQRIACRDDISFHYQSQSVVWENMGEMIYFSMGFVHRVLMNSKSLVQHSVKVPQMHLWPKFVHNRFWINGCKVICHKRVLQVNLKILPEMTFDLSMWPLMAPQREGFPNESVTQVWWL